MYFVLFEGRIVEDYNLGNDHGFISKQYISIGTKSFGKPKTKP